MYLKFAWRYFRAKKSANAINIIAWLTVVIIAFATCCQALVLSVFNGFEGLVKSLYSSFYADVKIAPANGKTFLVDPSLFRKIEAEPYVNATSGILQEKALLKNGDEQTMIAIKGVDSNYRKVCGVSNRIVQGSWNLGTAAEPGIVLGYGIQSAISVIVDSLFQQDELTLITPKKSEGVSTALDDLSSGNVNASGVFAIQQDFDNQYALTNNAFLKGQLHYDENEFTSLEVKLKPGVKEKDAVKKLQALLGPTFLVQDRYQQNTNLYATMQLEKWIIFAMLNLILIIAAFNIISAVTMLVLEKSTDISILKSLGTTDAGIKKIFLLEGLVLGIIGSAIGIALVLTIAWLQTQYKLVKLAGGTFLIDYFPVEIKISDLLVVAVSSIFIAFVAAYIPAAKAAKRPIELK